MRNNHWLKRSLVWCLIALGPLSLSGQIPPQKEDSCVSCHSNKSWRVTHKRLYEYYQRWTGSTHESEGVTCSDCHGGDSSKTDEVEAHGTNMDPERNKNSVNFRQIPETCGTCHDTFYTAYRQSKHFKNLEGSKLQGPNCITCHGSMNTSRPSVNTVREICQQCHKPDSKLDVPGSAESLLNDLNTIRRYQNFIQKRADVEEARKIFKQLDPLTEKLSESWHHFDLELIDKDTARLLKLTREKRDEISARQAAKRKEE